MGSVDLEMSPASSETGFHAGHTGDSTCNAAKDDIQFLILPLSPKGGDYRCAPACRDYRCALQVCTAMQGRGRDHRCMHGHAGILAVG